MKLLGSTESKITKDKNGEQIPHLEVVELIIVHCNIINKNFQRDSRILYTFVQNEPLGSLLKISPPIHIVLKTFNSKFQKIKVWLTDQNCRPLQVADKINLTMIIK